MHSLWLLSAACPLMLDSRTAALITEPCSACCKRTLRSLEYLSVCAELQKGAFAKVRWMRDSLPTLYAVVNLNMKSEGYVLKYEQVRLPSSNCRLSPNRNKDQLLLLTDYPGFHADSTQAISGLVDNLDLLSIAPTRRLLLWPMRCSASPLKWRLCGAFIVHSVRCHSLMPSGLPKSNLVFCRQRRAKLSFGDKPCCKRRRSQHLPCQSQAQSLGLAPWKVFPHNSCVPEPLGLCPCARNMGIQSSIQEKPDVFAMA